MLFQEFLPLLLGKTDGQTPRVLEQSEHVAIEGGVRIGRALALDFWMRGNELVVEINLEIVPVFSTAAEFFFVERFWDVLTAKNDTASKYRRHVVPSLSSDSV